MTKARDTANIVGGGFSGTIAGATMEPTGDTAAGDNAAIGFTSAEGLIITGQGSTNDVTIKNDADADVIEIPTGTVNVTMAGTLGVTGVITGGGLVVPDGSIAIADLDIDGGTDIGAALVDADLMIVDDGAGGTNRKATMTRLSTYIATKITGGSKVFIASTGVLSNAASVSFTQFDDSKFDHYEFMFQYVVPATDNVQFLGHASIDGGNSYDTTDGNYHVFRTVDSTGFVMSDQNLGSASGEYGLSGTFHLYGPHLQFFTYGSSRGVAMNDDGSIFATDDTNTSRTATAHLSANDVNAIQFKMTSGNIESGEIVMYGIANGS